MKKKTDFWLFLMRMNGQPNLSKLVSDQSHEPTTTGNDLHMLKETIRVRFAAATAVWRLWKKYFLKNGENPYFWLFLRCMNGQPNLSKLVSDESHEPTTADSALHMPKATIFVRFAAPTAVWRLWKKQNAKIPIFGYFWGLWTDSISYPNLFPMGHTSPPLPVMINACLNRRFL